MTRAKALLFRILKNKQIVITDTFTRPNNPTSLGNTETGQTWEYFTGVFAIENQRARQTSTSTNNGVACINCNNSNVDISVEFKYDEYSSICFRVLDQVNHYRVRLSSSGFALFRMVNGTATNLMSQNITPSVGQTYIMRVVAKGNSLKCYLNETLLIDIADNYYMTQTRHGVFASNTKDTFDNVVIKLL